MLEPTGSGFEATERTHEETNDADELHHDYESARGRGATTDSTSTVIDRLLISTERDVLCSTKKQQLVNELRSRGLPCSGRKDDIVSRLLEDNEKRRQLSKRSNVPTILQAAYDDKWQTNLQAALFENRRLREERERLRRQLARVGHTFPTVSKPAASLQRNDAHLGPETRSTHNSTHTNETTHAKRCTARSLDLSQVIATITETQAKVSEFLARSRTTAALTTSQPTSYITHAQVFPATSNETRNVLSAHEPERSTYLVPASSVQTLPTNGTVPELVELTKQTPRAPNATEPVHTKFSAHAVPAPVHATNDNAPGLVDMTPTNETQTTRNASEVTNDIVPGLVELTTTAETNSARNAPELIRTTTIAPAAPARVHPTNDTALAQVNPSTSNYAPSTRGTFEPERTSSPAPVAPIETHPTNTAMVQEDAAVSVRAPGKRDAIEPACTRGMPTAALSTELASNESLSDDTDTARTTTNETDPDKGIECPTEEATPTTPKIVAPNGRGELRPFSHNSFASEGNHGEGEQGVATNLSDQPRHFTTTPRHRRLNERTNGSRTERNTHLEQNNALNAPNSATFTERISPPDETHANVPTRIKPARSYTDSIADGSDVTNATP
ncbi:uncharacterized protein LOC144155232 [Haemaphysalis longicornis]